MDRSSSSSQVDHRSGPQLLQHRVDTKLWVDQNDNEDDFYSNLGHSFDYQPDPIAGGGIDAGFFGEDEDRELLDTSDMATSNVFVDKHLMESGIKASKGDNANVIDAEIKLTETEFSATSSDHIPMGNAVPNGSPNENLIENVLVESDLARKQWNEAVSKCNNRFGQLEQEIQTGLESFQKTVDSLLSFSKSASQILGQLRLKAQLAIEEGEGKVQLGQNLTAMLVDANRIARSFEESVSMGR